MAETATTVRSDSVPERRLDSRARNFGGLLLVGGRRSALQLDATAGFILRRIDGRRTVHEIAELVAAEYGVDLETATSDVVTLVGQLLDGEIVTLA
jgi:hypothetical protein